MTTGKFWAWAAGAIGLLLLATAVTAGLPTAFCGLALLVFLVLAGSPYILGFYLLYRLLRYLTGKITVVDSPSGGGSARAAAERRSRGTGNKAALISYIEDAARLGRNEEGIRSDLVSKGWPLEEVDSAFARYREVMGGLPVGTGG